MVNRGKEKVHVRVHVNVVLHSTMNTNGGTENQLWELALVKGIREPHEVNKNSYDLSGNRTHDLRIGTTFILF